MQRRLSWGGACAIALLSTPAFADKVVLLDPTGGDAAADDAALRTDLQGGMVALGHTLVPDAEVNAAIASDPALAQRTPDALRALGAKLGADWVVSATDTPAVTTERVEIGASYARSNRFELVGREVHRDRSAVEVKEMLAVLLRPEGVGTAALPWETAPTAPPPAKPQAPTKVIPPKPTPVPEAPPKPTEAYGGGHWGFIAAGLGADGLVKRPKGAQGSAASMVGVVRGGIAIASTGLEPYLQIGGRLAGASSFWGEAGVRWMGIPILHEKGGVGLHLGPSFHGGVFVIPGHTATDPGTGTHYTTPSQTTGTLGGAVDLALRLAGRFQIDAQIAEVRFAPLDEGSTVSVGGNLTGDVRF